MHSSRSWEQWVLSRSQFWRERKECMHAWYAPRFLESYTGTQTQRKVLSDFRLGLPTSMMATKAIPLRHAPTPFQASLAVSGWQLKLITEETYSPPVPPLLQILLSISKIIYLHPPKLLLFSIKGKTAFFYSVPLCMEATSFFSLLPIKGWLLWGLFPHTEAPS